MAGVVRLTLGSLKAFLGRAFYHWILSWCSIQREMLPAGLCALFHIVGVAMLMDWLGCRLGLESVDLVC
jgi:hypothetical protein